MTSESGSSMIHIHLSLPVLIGFGLIGEGKTGTVSSQTQFHCKRFIESKLSGSSPMNSPMFPVSQT